jgi:hypothetical protein
MKVLKCLSFPDTILDSTKDPNKKMRQVLQRVERRHSQKGDFAGWSYRKESLQNRNTVLTDSKGQKGSRETKVVEKGLDGASGEMAQARVPRWESCLAQE